MDLSRQKDLVDSRILNTPVIVVGAGAIGSFTVLALAKIGFKSITVYDDDTIEEHNIPNQFYPPSYIGVDKVKALSTVVRIFAGEEVALIPVAKRWDKNVLLVSPTGSQAVVISAVDTMVVRKELYNSIVKSNNIFVDGRMGGHQLEVRTCIMNDIEDKVRYKKTLWKDSETSPLPCTQKAVMYNVLMIASLIANQCRLTLENKPYNREIIYDFETGIMLSSNECIKVK